MPLASKGYINTKASLWMFPAVITNSNVSTFEPKHTFDNHLARFRPRDTAHIQSPPSNNAVSVAPYYPQQQGLITE